MNIELVPQREFEFIAQNRRLTRSHRSSRELRIEALREEPKKIRSYWYDGTPDTIVDYWRQEIETAYWYSPERECAVVILLNTAHKITGFHLITIGILDAVLFHPREAFRAAIIAAAHSVVFVHNHPSGDPTPSDSDVAATKDMVRAGELLKLPVLDHVIISPECFVSLRERMLWR